jgi:hypothetical protein
MKKKEGLARKKAKTGSKKKRPVRGVLKAFKRISYGGSD